MPTYVFKCPPVSRKTYRVYALSFDKAVLAIEAKLDEEARNPRSKLKPQKPWPLQLRDVEGM
jgi:hypothetical protein